MMAGRMLIEVTEDNFNEEVLNSDLPVFACFTTSWCRSCFPTCLVADKLVDSYEERIKFVRIDSEKATKLSDRYQIRVAPSILLFRGHEMIKELLGYQEINALRDLLDTLLEEAEGAGENAEANNAGASIY